MESHKSDSQSKKAYVAPSVQSQKVFERAALSCSHSAYSNSQWDYKDSWWTCGYHDS